jgi:hypothetical protein
VGSWSLPLPLLHPGHDGTGLPLSCAPTLVCDLTIVPKAMEPFGHELKPPKHWFKINLSFFYFEGTAFELKVSCLLSRYSIAWATPSALFCCGSFWDRVSLYVWASLNHDSSISWDDRHAPLCQFFGWDGVWQTFCLVWPGTMILPISASVIVGMTDMV